MLENLQYWVNSTMTTASGSSWDFIHEPEHLLYDYLLLFSIACLNFFFFSRFFFNLDHFFKVFIKFVMILLLFFMFRCFGHKAYSILVPRPEIKPHGHDWTTEHIVPTAFIIAKESSLGLGLAFSFHISYSSVGNSSSVLLYLS